MKGKCSELNFYRYRLLVRIEGFKIERLLQQALDRGITLRSLRMLSDTCAEGWIAAEDLKALRKLAKSLYRIRVMDGRGPEQRLRQAAAKPVAVIGTILATAIVIVQSLFISEIRVDGYRAIPEEELVRCLAEAGVSPGGFRPSVDWQKAEEALDRTFPQLSWIQLVYDGRVVYLNVSESTGKKFDVVHLLGGGTKDGFLCEMTAISLGIPVIAGPVEATALGNIMLQLIALGEVSDINEARKMIAETQETKKYAFDRTADWDKAYEKYKSILQNNKEE